MKYDDLGRPLGEEIPGWQGALPPERVTLTGQFCQLVPFDLEQHGAQLRALLAADQAAWAYIIETFPQTDADWEAWLTSRAHSCDRICFVIIDQANGDVVGTACYLRINPLDGSIEVGSLHFSPHMKRTPMATEAMYLMMRQAFAWGYRRYEWKCNQLNAASLRAAQRLGFTFEGVFRQACVIRGLNRDTAWFSLLDHEWPKAGAALEAWLQPNNFDTEGCQRQTLESLREAN